MAITTEQIKELRDKTGVSVMQCKKALEEAGGDMNKAIVILKKKAPILPLKKPTAPSGPGPSPATFTTPAPSGPWLSLFPKPILWPKTRPSKLWLATLPCTWPPPILNFESTDISEAAKKSASEVFEKEIEKDTKKKPENIREQILYRQARCLFQRARPHESAVHQEPRADHYRPRQRSHPKVRRKNRRGSLCPISGFELRLRGNACHPIFFHHIGHSLGSHHRS